MAWNWKFWKKNEVVTRSTVIPWRADSFNNHLFGLGYPTDMTVERAMRFTPFARCVKVLSEKGANLIANSTRVIDVRTGQVVKTAHAERMLALVRESPNNYNTSREFFEWVIQDYLIYGNAIVWAVPGRMGGTGVTRLVRMNAQTATADIYDMDRGPESLIYTLQPFGYRRNEDMYHQSEIIHSRYKSPDVDYMNYNGTWMSGWPIRYLGDAIKVGIFCDSFVGNFFDDALKNDIIVKFEQGLGDEQQAEIIEAFQLAQTDKRNPMVAPHGADIQQLKHDPQSQTVEALRTYQVNEIGRFYGVPGPMLNLDSTAWGGGLEELHRQFWSAGAKLAVDSILDKFSLKLLPAHQRFETDLSEEIKANSKTLVAMIQATKGTRNNPPLISREEARKWMGLYDPFIDDYGDYFAKIDGKDEETDDFGEESEETEDENEEESDIDTDEESSDNPFDVFRDNR